MFQTTKQIELNQTTLAEKSWRSTLKIGKEWSENLREDSSIGLKNPPGPADTRTQKGGEPHEFSMVVISHEYPPIIHL